MTELIPNQITTEWLDINSNENSTRTEIIHNSVEDMRFSSDDILSDLYFEPDYKNNIFNFKFIGSISSTLFKADEVLNFKKQNWTDLHLDIQNITDVEKTIFNVKTIFNKFLDLCGILPNLNLISDSEIIRLSQCAGQYGFTLDAPNLRELTVDINTVKTMILSPQTPKDIKIITIGKEGVIVNTDWFN